MAFDIKKIIEDIITKIKGDKDIGERFQKDPTKTVEGLIGVDLPDDQIQRRGRGREGQDQPGRPQGQAGRSFRLIQVTKAARVRSRGLFKNIFRPPLTRGRVMI